MSEQSAQPNSQPERSIEERVEALFDDPVTDNEQKEETQQEEAQASTETESETESKDQPETEEKTEPTLPEAVDVEYEGKQYKVAPELKEALLRQADYTKKTQEAAEARKTAEVLMQQAQSIAELQKAQSKQLGQLASLDDKIAQYEKVDWNQLTAQDAAEAQRHFIAFQQAKDQRQKLVGELNEAQEKQRSAAMAAHAARLEEGQKALQRDIKGWNAELGQKLSQFGMKQYGFTAEEAASVIDPRTVRLLNDAFQLHQLRASKPALENKVPPKSPTLTPKGSDARSAQQQGYDQDRRSLKSAKSSSEMAKAAERLIARKLG